MDAEQIEQRANNLKTVALANSIHNLTPPARAGESDQRDVAIVSALRVKNYIDETILQLKGFMYDPLKEDWVEYRNPIMNAAGIGNFIQALTNIGSTIEYSNFREEEIPKFVVFLFDSNYPYFTIYYQDYNLDKRDFNIIKTLLFNFILTSLFKAKGAGHRNVVRGTYSEDLLGRVINTDRKSEGGILSAIGKLNPLRKRE